jgi:hypothetical protein
VQHYRIQKIMFALFILASVACTKGDRVVLERATSDALNDSLKVTVFNIDNEDICISPAAAFNSTLSMQSANGAVAMGADPIKGRLVSGCDVLAARKKVEFEYDLKQAFPNSDLKGGKVCFVLAWSKASRIKSQQDYPEYTYTERQCLLLR